MGKKFDFRISTTDGAQTGLDQYEPILLSRRAVALSGLGLAAAMVPSRSRAWDGPLTGTRRPTGSQLPRESFT
jgi:hypothetical protein